MYVQMDGTGLPMVAKETEERSGKGEDGRAHTREAKLGCVFTQTTTDDQGRPVRDEDSTTYTGAIETAKRRWVMSCQHLLDDGKIEKLVAKLRTLSPDNPELAAAVRTEANYFERNAERMRYPEFRRKGLFVGSGVIEAGCKTVIGSRLKRSGMRHARKRVLDRPRRQRRDCASMLSLQPTL
jgi:hypothetical protein